MNRIITAGLVGLMVVVAAMGWLFGISPLLDQANSADEQRATVEDLNNVNEARVVDLKTKFTKIDELSGQVALLRTSVPERLDIPTLLREINGYSAAKAVTLVSVTVGTAEMFTPSPAAPAPAATPAPASGGTAAPVAAAPASSALVKVPIQVTVSGDYNAVMAFGGSLQTGPRLFLAKSFNLASTPTGFSGVLAGFVYALPPVGTDVPAPTGTQNVKEAAGVAPKG